ncbi:MAG: MFS transporter [Clostridia bacterium]|nr:MFS transporter [Clostridia bacterium]
MMLLICAQACSLTGGYVQTAVLSWVAADLGGGLYSLSAYLLACYLPVAVLSYPFGRWLDQRPQKGWLLLSETVLAVLSFVLWRRAENLTFPFLLGFGALWGVVRAFQTPIYQSLPRRLTEKLSKGTALLTAVTYAARGVGPILGGLLYQKWGAGPPFLLNFISFIPSVIFLAFLRLPEPQKSTKIRLRKWLLPLGKIFLVSFFAVNYNVTFVALVKEAGMGSGSYGFALGLLGAGALMGFALKKHLPQKFLVAGMGLLNLALAFFSGLWLRGLCILLYGILDFGFFSTALYRLSKAAQKEEITSVMGLYTVVTVGAMPLGALFWSAVSKAWGLQTALAVIGGGLILLFLIFKGDMHEKRTQNF